MVSYSEQQDDDVLFNSRYFFWIPNGSEKNVRKNNLKEDVFTVFVIKKTIAH